MVYDVAAAIAGVAIAVVSLAVVHTRAGLVGHGAHVVKACPSFGSQGVSFASYFGLLPSAECAARYGR